MLPKEIQDLLEHLKISYEIIPHEVSGKTTEDAEKALGIPRENILKSLLLENRKNEYLRAILPGNKKVDFGKIKEIARQKNNFSDYKFSMATPETVEKVLGYKIGGVPPFVFYLRKIPVYVDVSIQGKNYVVGAGGSEFVGIKFNPSCFEKLNYCYEDISK